MGVLWTFIELKLTSEKTISDPQKTTEPATLWWLVRRSNEHPWICPSSHILNVSRIQQNYLHIYLHRQHVCRTCILAHHLSLSSPMITGSHFSSEDYRFEPRPGLEIIFLMLIWTWRTSNEHARKRYVLFIEFSRFNIPLVIMDTEGKRESGRFFRATSFVSHSHVTGRCSLYICWIQLPEYLSKPRLYC